MGKCVGAKDRSWNAYASQLLCKSLSPKGVLKPAMYGRVATRVAMFLRDHKILSTRKNLSQVSWGVEKGDVFGQSQVINLEC